MSDLLQKNSFFFFQKDKKYRRGNCTTHEKKSIHSRQLILKQLTNNSKIFYATDPPTREETKGQSSRPPGSFSRSNTPTCQRRSSQHGKALRGQGYIFSLLHLVWTRGGSLFELVIKFNMKYSQASRVFFNKIWLVAKK